MVKSVTLKHVVRREGKQAVFFYDGAATAENGLLSLPASRPEWIRRAWNSGYNLNPENDARLTTWAEVEELIEKQNAKSVKSAKSAEDTSEGSDNRGQSKARDGVRQSEQKDSPSVSESGPRSRRGRGSNDGETKAEE